MAVSLVAAATAPPSGDEGYGGLRVDGVTIAIGSSAMTLWLGMMKIAEAASW